MSAPNKMFVLLIWQCSTVRYLIKVNIIEWNRDTVLTCSRDSEKIDITPLHSYFPRYTHLSGTMI